MCFFFPSSSIYNCFLLLNGRLIWILTICQFQHTSHKHFLPGKGGSPNDVVLASSLTFCFMIGAEHLIISRCFRFSHGLLVISPLFWAPLAMNVTMRSKAIKDVFTTSLLCLSLYLTTSSLSLSMLIPWGIHTAFVLTALILIFSNHSLPDGS